MQIIAIVVVLAGIAAAFYYSDYNPLNNGWFGSGTNQEEQKPAAKAPAPSSPAAVTSPAPKPVVNQQGFTSNIQVAVRGFSFISQEVRVKAGTKITWLNEDAAGHTVTSNTNLFSSKLLSQGKSFEFIFNKPGEYPYHCAIHPSMTGKIIVEP